jgi:hypothetical protein
MLNCMSQTEDIFLIAVCIMVEFFLNGIFEPACLNSLSVIGLSLVRES